jgi:hypothetical protein
MIVFSYILVRTSKKYIIELPIKGYEKAGSEE